MIETSTYALVPGAWLGGWSWRPVAERLRAAGHRAITLTLPGLNDAADPTGYRLNDAIDCIVDAVHRLKVDNVVLVAHSWGGFPATGAARLLAGRVSKIVYYNAHVPVRGQSLVDENPPDKRELMLRMIAESPTGAIAPRLEYVQQELMQGVAPQLQRLVADLMTPQPGGYFLGALDFQPVDLGIPMVYIAAADDWAMPRPAVESAARLRVDPVIVPGTHNGMLTHPDEVANAIIRA